MSSHLQSKLFKLSLKYFQKIIKQLLNSVLAGYEESLTPRFVLSASAFDLIQQLFNIGNFGSVNKTKLPVNKKISHKYIHL